jgi:hypothetical protein
MAPSNPARTSTVPGVAFKTTPAIESCVTISPATVDQSQQKYRYNRTASDQYDDYKTKWLITAVKKVID